MDSVGNIVFATHIVDYEATVVNFLTGADKDYCRTGQSFEFCRQIYDLMKKHCPEVIEKQDKFYQKMNYTLEGLLFGKKDMKGTSKPSTATE